MAVGSWTTAGSAGRKAELGVLAEVYSRSNNEVWSKATRLLSDIAGAVHQATVEHSEGAMTSIDVARIRSTLDRLCDHLEGKGQQIPTGIPPELAKSFL